MSPETGNNRFENFFFRDLHPNVLIGTASDRYAGWIGQIYTEGRYKVQSRSNKVGGKSFKEEVLPVESVREYFQHFPVLEIDYTFYSLLVDNDLKPTNRYHVLQTYRKHFGHTDRVILKVPQAVFAQRIRRGGKFVDNPDYLNPRIFTDRFYSPVMEIAGDLVTGFVFEQEYQPKKDRIGPKEYIDGLDTFFSKIPNDDRYHIETRTESYYTGAYFDLLRTHGIGYVLSHWTWLPPLRQQFLKAGGRFFNSGKKCIVRLMTPLRMRYEEAYAQAFPFDTLVDGMTNRNMVQDTVEIIREAIRQGVQANVIINNRAGGNAPLIAREVATRFLGGQSCERGPV